MRQWMKDDRGSFTLEASIVIPILILTVFALLALTETVYEKIGLEKALHQQVERSAYTWNNSSKQIETGAFDIEANDGLYWRWTGNDIFASLFGASDYSTLTFPEDLTGQDLVSMKLQRSVEGFRSDVTGTFEFQNYMLLQSVTGSGEFVYDSPLLQIVDPPLLQAESVSYIVDPVELNRTVDFLRTYGKKLMDTKVSKKKASEQVNRFLGLENGQAAFRYHKDTLPYLRKLVGSVKHDFYYDTAHGKRQVDAMDNNGVVHQSYLTFNSKIREQLEKDADLLKNNSEVKGIVWHFFRRTGQTGKVGPSDALRKEIESKGIVIVIHDGTE
ncbi:TadE/TadG family type IV pilus assembly protein [Marinicrinis lubricantis]|uniref:TadE/TadG family type IV pilus assembly protein n=1 Tax=Marinicrinis lubricantis TaxID=2086470 RepID=A0ABW1IU40_9BACL